MIDACFIHSGRCLSRNSSANIPELTTSWCSISRTVRRNVIIDHGGCPLRAAINSSHCSLWTPAERYTVSQRPFTSIWIYSHPTASCFVFWLLPVLRMIFKSVSWVICLVAALGALRWTNWCLRSPCVPMIGIPDVVPANRLDLDPLSPGWGGSVSMIWWCGIGEKDDNEKKWEALRTI